MQFSLFYFSSQIKPRTESLYNLLWEGARFADQNEFTAVWTPERHFDEFGGPFPAPALTAAALAMITKNIQIRAGSLVLPLQNPIRVAEEWAMLDHFSKGRIGIAFASGWHTQDFSLAPANYLNRKNIMLEYIETIKKCWKNQSINLISGDATEVNIQTYPQPLQKEIPLWLSASGNPDTFRMAAENKVAILTHLLDQDVQALETKIAIYRSALKEKTDWPGHVTLMLHTFIGNEVEAVKNLVKPHLKSYLLTAMKLANKQQQYKMDDSEVSPEDVDVILDYAFERFYKGSSLIGTPESCLPLINKLKEIGVDEIACFIDFGMEDQAVLDNLPNISKLKKSQLIKKGVPS
jgi:natural product biosynthesis luciferase-like monooxygenase protein